MPLFGIGFVNIVSANNLCTAQCFAHCFVCSKTYWCVHLQFFVSSGSCVSLQSCCY